MKKVLVIISLIIIQGCTHSLYQSDIVAKNNLDQEQAYRLWWIKTSVLSSQKGSGSMMLDMGCSVHALTDSAEGIVMILPADQYTTTIGQEGAKLNCAKVNNIKSISQFDKGDILINATCSPQQEEFSLVEKTFLGVNTTHKFPVIKSEIKDVSDAPERLPCP